VQHHTWSATAKPTPDGVERHRRRVMERTSPAGSPAPASG